MLHRILHQELKMKPLLICLKSWRPLLRCTLQSRWWSQSLPSNLLSPSHKGRTKWLRRRSSLWLLPAHTIKVKIPILWSKLLESKQALMMESAGHPSGSRGIKIKFHILTTELPKKALEKRKETVPTVQEKTQANYRRVLLAKFLCCQPQRVPTSRQQYKRSSFKMN